jgi:uncharacterized protein (DUF2147 family)
MSVLLIFAASAASPSAIFGRWNTPGDKAVVEIAPCGKQVCGTIISAAPLPTTGQPPRDSRNPDPALRNRPMAGVRILSGFSQSGDRWKAGTIYNPANGKTYTSELTLAAGGGQLKVSGCVMIFCQTQIWTRAK